jgi:site-specific recombinase XerD
MNEEGAGAFAIQTALGHAKVATTMRYVQVRDEERRAAFESLALNA